MYEIDKGQRMIQLLVKDGCASVAIDHNLAIDVSDRNLIQALAAEFGHLLPTGRHQLEALADAMERSNPASIVLPAFADQLRETQAQLSPAFLADPAFVSHLENTEGRDFVVGDIHGQYDALLAALLKVRFDRKRDRLFSVGDLVDRGARSFDCLSLPFEPFFHGVLGNHEWLALNALSPKATQHAWDLWQQNGGAWVLGENAKEVAIIAREAARYLPLAREVMVAGKRVGICHAEPPYNWQWLKDCPESLVEPTIWSRTRYKQRDETRVEGIDLVVVGHTIVGEPTLLGNVLYIDTGAFTKDGGLTLLNLADRVHQAGAADFRLPDRAGIAGGER